MNLRRDPAAKLGELLAARGKLDREALLRALRHQRTAGGRIGTCLLEVDAAAEDDLLAALAEQLKVPFLAAEDLRDISPEVLRLVPAKSAVKLCAVPVRASSSQLTLAMRDPLDLAGLDELAFVSGRRIRAHVALEARLQEALAKHYRVETPRRFVQLADRLNRARFLWRDATDGETPQDAAQPPTPAAPAPPGPLSPYPEPPPAAGAPPRVPELPSTPPPAPVATPAPAAPPPAAPPVAIPRPAPLAFEEAVSRLAEPSDRDAVAETLVEFLVGRVDAGMLLMVRRDEAAGWRGCGLPNEVVRAVRLPLGEPSIVLALRDGAPLQRGALAPLRGNATLIAALGADLADLVALPLAVRGRLVGVVLAVNRRSALEPGLVDDLQRLALKASAALEMLVLRQKLRQA